MLLYYLFWMFMGFILYIIIIFGTNLLTGVPAVLLFFCLFQYFEEKEYQTESKWNETSGAWFLERTWSRGLGVQVKKQPRRPREGRAPPPPIGHAPLSRGALKRPPTYFFLLYMSTDPENIQEHHEKLFPPPQPSVPVRFHLGAFSCAPREGESITEGFYINTIASPMMCE